jgi:hypothetical protein
VDFTALRGLLRSQKYGYSPLVSQRSLFHLFSKTNGAPGLRTWSALLSQRGTQPFTFGGTISAAHAAEMPIDRGFDI